MVRKSRSKKEKPLHRSYFVHLKRHIHLHLTHRGLYHPYIHNNNKIIRMKQAPEFAEASSSADQQGFMREISMLQKSRSLKDPSTYTNSPSRIRSASLKLKKFGKTSKLAQHSSSLYEIREADKTVNTKPELDELNSSEREGSWLEINPADGKKINVEEVASNVLYREELVGNNSRLFNAIKRLEIGRQDLGYTDLLSQRGVGMYGMPTTKSDEVLSLESERERQAFAGWEFSAGKSKSMAFVGSELSAGKAKSMAFGALSAGFESNIGKSRSRIKGSTRRARLRKNKRPRSPPTNSRAHMIRSTREERNWTSLTKANSGLAQKTRDELEISELSHNGCGLPWINWSRIHMKGKNIPRNNNIVSGNVSCATSELLHMRGRGKSLRMSSSEDNSMPCTTSEFSDSSFNTDSDSFPLLERCNIPSDIASIANEEEEVTSPSGHSLVLRGKYTSQSVISEKYMPKTFQQIVGQGLITQALSNTLSRGRIAKLYIFYGPRGVGKTSCARVFSMALNCVSMDKTRPCGSCTQCLLAQKHGKTCPFMELSVSGMGGSKGFKQLFHEISKPVPLKYRVVIANECHMLSTQSWDVLMKVVENTPRNVVFILSTSSLERLPHAIISSGYQKFIFSKIKESEILNRLKMIAECEGFEVEVDALKLIATSCDGSLRDAETILDQLSLLGHRISLAMAQELMGLVPDGRLLDLLDFALSADTVNTVRNLKELMTSGVDPLSLMSQLACLITSILAGGYKIPQGRCRRRFFRKNELGKEGMEQLRQALKTLSEAEKQLRGTSDQTTWLTAALLQFAPDHSYLLPSPSWNTSFTPSSGGLNTTNFTPGDNHPIENHHQVPQMNNMQSRGREFNHMTMWKTNINNVFELEDVWQRILDAVHSSNLRKFLQSYGKLSSLSLQKGLALAVLEFHELDNISRAQRSKASIAHAFEVTLGCPVDVKMQFVSKIEGEMKRKSFSRDLSATLCSNSTLNNRSSCPAVNGGMEGKQNNDGDVGRSSQLGTHCRKHRSHELYREREGPSMSRNLSGTIEIVELGKSNGVAKHNSDEKLENAWVEGASRSNVLMGSSSERGQGRAHHNSRMMESIGRNHPGSLGFAIQEVEDGIMEDASDMQGQPCRHQRPTNFVCGGAIADHGIATQLEEENLRLESRSGRLQCWHGKNDEVKQVENNQRRSGLIWRFCSCGISKYS